LRIGNVDIGELKPIPTIESGDEKEVYAFYGLAAFNAQCAEKALVNFAMGYKLLDSSALNQEEWLELYDGLSSRTFGRLLNQVKKQVELPNELRIHLEETLEKRNWLAHNFFYDFAVHLADFDGRVVMIDELQKLILLFQIADRSIEKLSSAVWEQFGVTDDWIQTEMNAQIHEYESTKMPNQG